MSRWLRRGLLVPGWTSRRQPRGSSPAGWRDLLDLGQRRLDELGIAVPDPSEFDLDLFVDQVVQRVRGGRPLELTEFRRPPGETTECGYTVLFRERSYDLVCYQAGFSDRARVHNAVHELAHLIHGHPGTVLTIGAIDRSEITSSQRFEDEADALAAVVLGRWDSSARTPEPPRGFAARQLAALVAARVDEAFS